ncbi:glucose-1-phosphatase [Mannheimia granulomatis]|uniref:Glucose-1-phosphatase n=1 Tax=Mannheimia granulomatis TaxID=85402 RepID=A0A6G8JG21_9PAST|nr:histidine-type phosphatase [Mannheimia granulomatis]QIM66130.1 glucose-1-phosphatase [Mannheimia granulomatis]
MKKLSIFSLALLMGLNTNTFGSNAMSSFSEKGYELKEVVVLSRHNIRAPLSGKDSVLGKATTHQWIDWSANPSELTSRGGVLESIMGQYFRKWLEKEGLLTENTCLNRDELNIYANSMQRTIATAEYFKSGFSPTCGIEISHRFLPSKMDPIFFPRLTKLSPEFKEQAIKEINTLGGKNSLKALTESLKLSFELIEKVMDMENSVACKEEKICKLDDFDTKMLFALGEEPNLSGSLKLATRIADALVLQYFEEPNDKIAGFGNDLSAEDWEKISRVKDVYGDVLFTAPSVATNVAHPLLVYLRDELNAKNRKFTYLVGHDSNIGSVTSALGVEEYSLPNTIEKKTPIGSKLLFEKWVNKETKKEYLSLNIMYQTTEQLRNLALVDLNNPPMIYTLKLSGLKPNEHGLYDFSEVNARFNEVISKYEGMK